LDVQRKTDEMAVLLLLGKTGEAKAKLEEWEKGVRSRELPRGDGG
jgi:hypothetical protein